MGTPWPQQNRGDASMPQTGPFRGGSQLFSLACSHSALPAASSASAAVVSEHPCVKLDEWWLARVKGQERKIAVAGIFVRNQADLDFAAVPIAKRHEPYVLETENGTVLYISGLFNIERTLKNGFTTEACKKFSLSHCWENWNVLSSQKEYQSRSVRISDSCEDSSRFLLEMFQHGKHFDSLVRHALNNMEAFSGNGDAFPDSSCLPNGAPRFEECTSDDDTPTIKKSAASSNHGNNKIENIETDSTVASILKERSNDGIDRNVPSASTVECTNGHQKTHVASLKRRGCLKKPQHVAFSETAPSEDNPTLAYSDMQSLKKGKHPVVPSRKQRSASGKLQRATRSPNIISQIPYGNLSPLTCGWAKSLSVSTPESLKLKKTRSGRVVVPALDSGRQNIVYASDGSISAIIGLYSPPPLKGSTSKNYARKKKRTNYLPDKKGFS